MSDNHRISQLKKLLEQEPADSFLLYALATEYVSLHDDRTALEYFTKLLHHDPDYAGTYYHLGKLYLRNNQPDLAEKTFREGMSRTMGKDAKAYRELQEAFNQMHDE
jgi:Tfp pilus assembly protein PilF